MSLESIIERVKQDDFIGFNRVRKEASYSWSELFDVCFNHKAYDFLIELIYEEHTDLAVKYSKAINAVLESNSSELTEGVIDLWWGASKSIQSEVPPRLQADFYLHCSKNFHLDSTMFHPDALDLVSNEIRLEEIKNAYSLLSTLTFLSLDKYTHASLESIVSSLEPLEESEFHCIVVEALAANVINEKFWQLLMKSVDDQYAVRHALEENYLPIKHYADFITVYYSQLEPRDLTSHIDCLGKLILEDNSIANYVMNSNALWTIGDEEYAYHLSAIECWNEGIARSLFLGGQYSVLKKLRSFGLEVGKLLIFRLWDDERPQVDEKKLVKDAALLIENDVINHGELMALIGQEFNRFDLSILCAAFGWDTDSEEITKYREKLNGDNIYQSKPTLTSSKSYDEIAQDVVNQINGTERYKGVIYDEYMEDEPNTGVANYIYRISAYNGSTKKLLVMPDKRLLLVDTYYIDDVLVQYIFGTYEHEQVEKAVCDLLLD